MHCQIIYIAANVEQVIHIILQLFCWLQVFN